VSRHRQDIDLVPVRARRRRGGGPFLVILGLVVIGVLIAGVVVLLNLTGDDEASDYPGPGSGSVTVVVKEGDPSSTIARALADAGVVLTSGAFVKAATDDERARGIAPGTYELKKQMTAAGALALMLDPGSRVDVVTIPEGTRVSDTLELIARETRLSLPALRRAADDVDALGLPPYASDAPSAEGFLFPAQYDVGPDEDAADFLRTMVGRYLSTTEGMDLAARARAAGRDPYDVVIVASIVQDEVSPADYAKAVRVIDNRIEDGMRLQLDSTVNYALGRKTANVTIADTQVDSPFNTYRNAGLPPGPINSPGEAAIEAALNPADGDWLYWVTTDLETGLTKFAETYEEFLVYKAEFDASQQ
jgi:UPF0755 protein